MTTNRKDTESHETTADDARGPVLTDPAAPEQAEQSVESDVTEENAAEGETAEHGDPEPDASAAAPQAQGFLAETLTLAGLLVLFGALSGLRILEVLPSMLAQSQEGMLAGVLLGEGATALLGVLLGLVGLMLAHPGTSTWVRWVAPAIIIVGLVLAATAAGAYLQVPEPQPQPPMIPGG
jgi:hypothetical protein